MEKLWSRLLCNRYFTQAIIQAQNIFQMSGIGIHMQRAFSWMTSPIYPGTGIGFEGQKVQAGKHTGTLASFILKIQPSLQTSPGLFCTSVYFIHVDSGTQPQEEAVMWTGDVETATSTITGAFSPQHSLSRKTVRIAWESSSANICFQIMELHQQNPLILVHLSCHTIGVNYNQWGWIFVKSLVTTAVSHVCIKAVWLASIGLLRTTFLLCSQGGFHRTLTDDTHLSSRKCKMPFQHLSLPHP